MLCIFVMRADAGKGGEAGWGRVGSRGGGIVTSMR